MGNGRMMFAQKEEDKKGKITILFNFKTSKLIIVCVLWQMDSDRGLISQQGNQCCSRLDLSSPFPRLLPVDSEAEKLEM